MHSLMVLSIIMAGAAGLFGHWLNRYMQGRSTASFGEYMRGNWAASMQSVFANISVIGTTISAIPLDITWSSVGSIAWMVFGTTYVADSVFNREPTAPQNDLDKFVTQNPTYSAPRKTEVSHENETLDSVLHDDATR
jgi:hypothetical protein